MSLSSRARFPTEGCASDMASLSPRAQTGAMRRHAMAVTVAALTLAIIATGCGGSGASPSRPSATRSSAPQSASSAASKVTFANWPTYGRTSSRSGEVSRGVHLPLHHSWTANLDGAVYGEPIVVGGKVIAATENDSVYALDSSTGKVLWRKHLGSPQPLSGLPCGDIDPLGITGTPAYDAKTGSVFVVAETNGGHHTLWALKATTGHKRWHRSLDVEKHRNRKAEQERSALL